MMVRIEVHKEFVSAILLDGYLPSEKTLLRGVDKLLYSINKTNPSRFNVKYDLYPYTCRKGLLSDKSRLNFFKRLVKKYRNAICPFSKNSFGQNISSLQPCHYLTIGINQKLEKYLMRHQYFRNIKNELQYLSEEAYHDLKKENDGYYIYNIIFYKNVCRITEACCSNWINNLNFSMKKDQSYKDVTLFIDAWKRILNHQLNCWQSNIDKNLLEEKGC